MLNLKCSCTLPSTPIPVPQGSFSNFLVYKQGRDVRSEKPETAVTPYEEPEQNPKIGRISPGPRRLRTRRDDPGGQTHQIVRKKKKKHINKKSYSVAFQGASVLLGAREFDAAWELYKINVNNNNNIIIFSLYYYNFLFFF